MVYMCSLYVQKPEYKCSSLGTETFVLKQSLSVATSQEDEAVLVLCVPVSPPIEPQYMTPHTVCNRSYGDSMEGFILGFYLCY